MTHSPGQQTVSGKKRVVVRRFSRVLIDSVHVYIFQPFLPIIPLRVLFRVADILFFVFWLLYYTILYYIIYFYLSNHSFIHSTYKFPRSV
jgi:hypothetical protein